MDVNKAKELVENTKSDFSEKHRVMRGLQILTKYQDHEECYFEHDVIWAGGFDDLVSKMSEDDVCQMAKMGWFCDSEAEHWAHF